MQTKYRRKHKRTSRAKADKECHRETGGAGRRTTKGESDMDEMGEIALEQGAAAGRAARGFATAAVLDPRCASCDGYTCLDCAEAIPHRACTRSCPDCLIDGVDWDGELEASRIITEVAGLHALDDAIAALDADEDEGEDRGRSA